MIKIQPVEIPTKGIAKYFTLKCLQIDLKKSSEAAPTFYWELKKAVPYAIDEVQTEIPGESILVGNLHMTTEEYALWGSDDSYALSWALGKLGLAELEEESVE
jgi:hypothetical protein